MTAPLKCRCTHARDVHGLDRKRRPVCWGSTVCGCGSFREPMPARTDGGPSLAEYLASRGER